jgi:hypothetical protein
MGIGCSSFNPRKRGAKRVAKKSGPDNLPGHSEPSAPFPTLINTSLLHPPRSCTRPRHQYTMKRSSASAEPEHGKKIARRQDPVSCEFCRRKKLKCDRVDPCSNCRARKLVCSLALGQQRCSSFCVLYAKNSQMRVKAPASLESFRLLQVMKVFRRGECTAFVYYPKFSKPFANSTTSQKLEEINDRVKRLEELLAPNSQFKQDTQSARSILPVSTAAASTETKSDPSEDDGQLCRTVSLMEADNFEHVPSGCRVRILIANLFPQAS